MRSPAPRRVPMASQNGRMAVCGHEPAWWRSHRRADPKGSRAEARTERSEGAPPRGSLSRVEIAELITMRICAKNGTRHDFTLRLSGRAGMVSIATADLTPAWGGLNG